MIAIIMVVVKDFIVEIVINDWNDIYKEITLIRQGIKNH